jgi:hypothetical protein
MYEAGELSRIMVSAIGLPNCDKSYGDKSQHNLAIGGKTPQSTLT